MRQKAMAAVGFGLLVSSIFTSGARAQEEGADSAPLPVYEPKRVLPPAPGTTRLITVQIDPEEQARILAALPPFVDPARGGGLAPGEFDDAVTSYPWFWNLISPSIAVSSPARLDLAVAALTDAGGASAVPSPRLQAMQGIAELYGVDILKATVGTRVSPALVLAVIGIESAGRAEAISNKGATGLMQLMPATAERFGVTDITAADQNIKGGVAYLDWLIGEFGADPVIILAAYNAGEGAVRRNDGVPPYRETRDYVPKVIAAWTVARGLCVTPPVLLSDGCVFNVRLASN